MEVESSSPVAVPQRFDVFLSYNSRDRAVVERIAQRLKRAGLEPWLDRWSLTPGGEWQRELGAGLDASVACAVFVGPGDLGAWELQEVAVAIDRAATQRGFRVFPVLLPGVEEPFDPNCLPHFLRARTWVDFRRGRDDGRALQDLINAVRGVPFGPDVPVAGSDDVVPYRGLRAFGEADAEFFFGRDREVQRLLEKLKSSRFVAVLGPSGSGKSSLVRAGLVPELRAGALADVDDWHVLVLRPGAAPLTALAAQLTKLLPERAMRATLDELRQHSCTLHLSVELALADRLPGERVLVVVDQLEEVFTLCRDEAERRQLFSTLLYATSAPGGRTTVIVTMRSDFYGRCAAYPEFAQLLTAQQMLVGPIDTDGLRQVIEEPARRVGLDLEEGLSDTILADVADEPGALPLLEHALLELWERRRGTMLTLEGYRQAGGVDGALAQRADEIFSELSPDQQEIARRTLLRLTQPGEGTEDTRRRATRSELAPPDRDDSFDEVLGRLVDARMLTMGRDESGEQVIDVSHEALIRGWPRLRAWIDADRAGLLIHGRLSDAAREWETLHREPAALYRGARLASAREWATDNADDLSALERDFLTISHTAEHSELEAAKRRSRRLRVLAAGLAALTTIVAVLAVWALGQRSDARQRETEATSLALASASAPLLNTRPDISLLLSVAAYRTSPHAEAQSSLLAALTEARDPGVRAILHGHTEEVNSVAFSPDGRTLASPSSDDTVRLWDVRTHKPRGKPLTGHTARVYGVAFSPDGRMLASASADRTVRLWDTRTHKPRGAPLTGHTSTVYAVAFSPDGRTLTSAGNDNTIRLWDVRTHKPRGMPLTGHTSNVYGVAFSPDGRTLASGSADGTLRFWDARTHEPRGAPLTGHTSTVYGVAFSPDGRTLASGSTDRTLRLWDTRTHTPRGAPLTGHTSNVYAVVFSSDGRTLASGSADGTLRLWDARTHNPLGAPLTGHTSNVRGVAFSPDGRMLASASADRTVRLWDTRSRRTLSAPLSGHTSFVLSAAFSPDGRTLASGGADNTVRLWDVRTRKPLGAPLIGHTSTVQSVAFGPGPTRRTLASASADKTIRMWDARTHNPLGAPLRGHNDVLLNVTFSRDGRQLASAGVDRTIRLWNARTHKALGAPLTGHTSPVTDVAFSPDGRTLASASVDKTVRLWDARTHNPLGAPLTGHTSTPTGVAFSPDGSTLASTSYDGTIRLWDARTHNLLGNPLTGHTSATTDVAFSPDGRTLASASVDKTVRLWDIRTHNALRTPLTGHTDRVNSVAFGPDGRTLVTASADKTIRLWDTTLWRSIAKLQEEGCNLVGSGLSKTEWAQYVPAIPYRQSCP